MKRLMTIALALGAITGAARGQWVQTAGPEGGVSRSMTEFQGAILAVQYPDVLYRLAPGASRWERIGTLAAENMFSVGGSIVATTDQRAMRSTDGGASWSPTGGAHAIVRDADNDRVYATDQALLFRSTDEGATWTRFGESLTKAAGPMFAPYGVAAAGDTILVGGSEAFGLFRSTDDGATWRAITSPFPDSASAQIIERVGDAFYAQLTDESSMRSRGVYRSTDGGVTWSEHVDGLPETPRGPAYAFSFYEEAGRVSAATIYGLYQFEDDRWVGVAPGIVVASASDSSGGLYRATLDGVHRSDDGGLTWERLVRGVLNMPVTAITTIGRSVLASASSGTHRSVDQGATWNRVGLDRIVEFVHGDGYVLARGERGTDVGLVRSTDGGLSWSPSSAGIEHPVTATSAISISDSVAYAAYTDTPMGPTPLESRHGGLYRSTDDGATWTLLRNGLPERFDTTLAVDLVAAVGPTVLAKTFVGVYRSTDGGESWATVDDLPVNFQSIRILKTHGGVFHIATGPDVYRSEDGLVWDHVGDGGAPLPTMVFTLTSLGDALVAIAGHEQRTDGIFMLANDTWHRYPTALPPGVAARNIVMTEGRLYASTSNNSVLRLDLNPSGVEPDGTAHDVTWMPHPLHGDARVEFSVEQPTDVSLEIIDATGALSRRVDGVRVDAGRGQLAVSTDGLAPGAYAYRLRLGVVSRSGVVIVAE